MNNVSLLTSLASGVLASFALFFLFYKALGWNNKISTVVTILIVQLIYVPLAAMNWDGLDVFAIHFAFFVMAAYGLGIITNRAGRKAPSLQTDGLNTETPQNTGWFHWAPATIVGFFLILAMVDSTIITLATKGASPEFMARYLPEPRYTDQATSVFAGTVAHDYRQKYELFNSHLSQLEVQRERGWQVSEGWQSEPVLGKATPFFIQIADRDGKPISGAEVQARFLRPANHLLDQAFQLTETMSGRYGNQVELQAPGAWSLLLTITRGEEIHEVKGDMWIPESPES